MLCEFIYFLYLYATRDYMKNRVQIVNFLNVPRELIQDFKTDKDALELLAFSLKIKATNGDSLLRNVSNKLVQKLCKCGYKKAEKLLKLAKEHSSLFYYNNYTNNLLAHDLKKEYIQCRSNKNGDVLNMIFAYKFEVKFISDCKLRELVKEIRCSLLKDRMTKNERNDSTYDKRLEGETSSKNISELIQGTSMSGRSMAKTIGAKSKTTAVRLMKEMVIKSEVAISRRGGAMLVDYCYSTQAFEHIKKCNPNAKNNLVWDRKSGAVYTCFANEYYVNKWDETRRFKNLIFNHSYRFKKQHTTQNSNDIGWFGEDEETITMASFM